MSPSSIGNARVKLTALEAMRPVLSLMKGADPSKDVSAARLGLSLLWLADDVIAAVNRKLERVNISEAKLDVLMIFAAQLGRPEEEWAVRQTPSGLSEYFGITKASATGLIDWLENRKLVTRTRHATDRRSTPVRITPKGKSWWPRPSRFSSRRVASWSTCSASVTAGTCSASSTNCGFTSRRPWLQQTTETCCPPE